MSSPFSNHQDFLDAKGPIYTFGNRPSTIAFFLIISAILFLWFIYAAYKIKNSKPPVKNPVVLSLLIATSVFSVANSLAVRTQMRQPPRTQEEVSAGKSQPSWLPVSLFGMIASGNLLTRRIFKNRRNHRH